MSLGDYRICIFRNAHFQRGESMTTSRLTTAFLLILGLGCPASCSADWANSFLFQTTGIDNPLVRVGFNPQPEPPGKWSFLDDSVRTRPMIRISDLGVSDGTARLLFGISGDYEIDAPGVPDGDSFQFTLVGENDATVVLTLFTESGGFVVPGTWEGFNPQPEPPGLGEHSAAIGFEFVFEQSNNLLAEAAFMSIQIFDQNNNPIVFSSVPEPNSVICLGWLASLMVNRRRR